jgi:hypothetical protein
MRTPEIVVLTVVIALNLGHGLMFAPESSARRPGGHGINGTRR